MYIYFFRELSVAGNRLECDGMNELLRPVVTLCEASQPPQPLPPLAKLFLQDNCIDTHGTCGGMFAPIICMRTLKRLDIVCVNQRWYRFRQCRLGSMFDADVWFFNMFSRTWMCHNATCLYNNHCYHIVALACRWILSSIVIEEVKLDGNLIGDGGGREILQAMQERKEGTHESQPLCMLP